MVWLESALARALPLSLIGSSATTRARQSSRTAPRTPMFPLLASPAYRPPAPRLGAFRPPAPLAPLLTAWELLAAEPSTDAERGAQRAIRTAAEITRSCARRRTWAARRPSCSRRSGSSIAVRQRLRRPAVQLQRHPGAGRRRRRHGGGGGGGGARPARCPDGKALFPRDVFDHSSQGNEPGVLRQNEGRVQHEGADKGGPANDEEWTDIGIEGDDSGRLTMWPGSKLVQSQKRLER